MKRAYRKAFNRLKKLGFDPQDKENGFEHIFDENTSAEFYILLDGDHPSNHIDYWDNYEGSDEVNDSLTEAELYFEYVNSELITIQSNG